MSGIVLISQLWFLSAFLQPRAWRQSNTHELLFMERHHTGPIPVVYLRAQLRAKSNGVFKILSPVSCRVSWWCILVLLMPLPGLWTALWLQDVIRRLWLMGRRATWFKPLTIAETPRRRNSPQQLPVLVARLLSLEAMIGAMADGKAFHL